MRAWSIKGQSFAFCAFILKGGAPPVSTERREGLVQGEEGEEERWGLARLSAACVKSGELPQMQTHIKKVLLLPHHHHLPHPPPLHCSSHRPQVHLVRLRDRMVELVLRFHAQRDRCRSGTRSARTRDFTAPTVRQQTFS